MINILNNLSTQGRALWDNYNSCPEVHAVKPYGEFITLYFTCNNKTWCTDVTFCVPSLQITTVGKIYSPDKFCEIIGHNVPLNDLAANQPTKWY